MQARMDWCVQPYNQANHQPVPAFNGNLTQTVTQGTTVNLSASGSTDPDGNTLSYNWMVYKEAGSYSGNITINNTNSINASFVAPNVSSPVTVHVILSVTDNGTPTLTRYKRIIYTITNGPPVAVTGVTVNPANLSITANSTGQLSPTISPSNATNQTVSWSSSNTAVATVSSSGLVTGVSAGSATITVTTQDGNKTASSAITVTNSTYATYEAENGTVSGGAGVQTASNASNGQVVGGLNNTGSYVQVGGVNGGSGGNASVVIRFANGNSDNRSLSLYVNGTKIQQVTFAPTVSWNTFADVASINITLNSGTGNTIKIQKDAADANAADIDKFTVTIGGAKIPVTGVSVNPTSATININNTQQLTATVSPSNATNKTVSWSSNNTGIATVSSSGLVTGVAAGTATITVTTADGNKTATSAITVNTVTGGCTASGTILYQRWDGISGTAVSDLTSNANYPNTPTSSSSLTSMEAGTNVADNYGARIAGYICAPSTGAYTFWIASDDASQLWLSTDGTASNKVKIAEVTSWTSSREWGKQTSQKSATINFTQGQSYYVEALMKEGGGGDNLAVGWLKPGQSGTVPSEVVPGSVLSPFVVGTTSITKVYEAENGSVSGGAQVQNASNASGGKTVGNINANNAYNQVSSVDGGAGGTASLVIRFANGSGSTKSLSLYVNNTKVQQVVFASTSDWNTFADQPAINITLNSGTGNTLKIQKDAADVNAADIDKYTVTTGGAKSAEQPIENDAVSANSTISVYPNPCDGNEITISGVEGQVTISITDLSGHLVVKTENTAMGSFQISNLNLHSGIYVMVIQNNRHSIYKKLVVK